MSERPSFDDSGEIVGTVDFAYDEIEGYADDDPLPRITGMVRWAGSSRARLAVLGLLLGQDRRTQGQIARDSILSKQAVSRAFRDGKEERARLTPRRR